MLLYREHSLFIIAYSPFLSKQEKLVTHMENNTRDIQHSVAEILIGSGLSWQRWIVVLITISVGLLISGLILLDRTLQNKITPNTSIDGVAVGGTTIEEARILLSEKTKDVPETVITLQVDDISIASSSAELGLQRNTEYLLEVALLHGKEQSFITRMVHILRSLTTPTILYTDFTFDEEKINRFISVLNTEVEIEGTDPAVSLTYSGNPQSIRVFEGKVGRRIEPDHTKQRLVQSVAAKTYLADAKVASTSSELSTDEAILFEEEAKKYVGKSLEFTHSKDTTIRVSDQDIISLLTYPSGISLPDAELLIEEWQTKVDREPQDAVFEYNSETLEVSKFSPHRNGRALQAETMMQLLTEKIDELRNSEEKTITVELPIEVVEPTYTLEKTNALGITERIGFGESYYHHSIPSRINNVAVTSKRINNILVAPGEEFSFNKEVGEISRATGYQPAYVITNGKTELGDGGGVCQVSSTLFRTLLDAGLDITRRLPHSYRVSYYELNSDPGFDATVYSGNVDLRFKNDTNHYVLVHTTNDPENLHLVIELYGTSDGRTTEITDYKKWGASPPLPTEYIEDPTLPVGVKKQVDWAVSGLKAQFTHTVKDKDGEIMYQDTYTSNYRPWSAKYLVGTKE